MLTRPQTKPFSGAVLFENATDMLEAMFGPDQHDWHVQRYHVFLKDRADYERWVPNMRSFANLRNPAEKQS